MISVVDGGLTLLRPGMIAVPGAIAGPDLGKAGEAHASPGLHPKHYSPLTPVVLLDPGQPVPEGAAYVWYRTPKPASKSVEMPDDPVRYAAAIYGVLHGLDVLGLPAIAIERVPNDDERWSAVADRLTRAAATAY